MKTDDEGRRSFSSWSQLIKCSAKWNKETVTSPASRQLKFTASEADCSTPSSSFSLTDASSFVEEITMAKKKPIRGTAFVHQRKFNENIRQITCANIETAIISLRLCVRSVCGPESAY